MAQWFPEINRCLEEGRDGPFEFNDLSDIDKKRFSSANGHERLNIEITWRGRIVAVFPSIESYVRLTI